MRLSCLCSSAGAELAPSWRRRLNVARAEGGHAICAASAPALQAKAYVAEVPPSKTLDTLAHVSSWLGYFELACRLGGDLHGRTASGLPSLSKLSNGCSALPPFPAAALPPGAVQARVQLHQRPALHRPSPHTLAHVSGHGSVSGSACCCACGGIRWLQRRACLYAIACLPPSSQALPPPTPLPHLLPTRCSKFFAKLRFNKHAKEGAAPPLHLWIVPCYTNVVCAASKKGCPCGAYIPKTHTLKPADQQWRMVKPQ